jgi:hypothetical protein
MTITLPQIEGSRLLTHSAEAAYKLCPRKYYLGYQLGLRPSFQSDALRLGSAFHLGLESLKAGEGLEAGVASIRASYGDHERSPYLTDEDYRTEEEIACTLVRGYHVRWGSDPIVEYVAVEQSFDLPIVNPLTRRETPLFRTGGKIDGIARLPDGRLALIEHKTTSDSIEPESDYWRRLMMDGQVSRYVIAAREIGYDVTTTVYDVVRKPGIRPKAIAKADRARANQTGSYFGRPFFGECPERETAEFFGARLLADLLERPAHYFARMEVPRLESDLDEFRYEQWRMQRTIRQAEIDAQAMGRAAWPRNTGACLNPYKCAYFSICTSGNDLNPETDIPQGYRRVDVLHEELATTSNTGAE